jgi:hypothetical protein
MDRNGAFNIVYEALDVVNELRPEAEQLTKSPDLLLFGEDGCLDSLALTTLVLSIERKVNEATGNDIDLFGPDVIEGDMSSLRTVSTLVGSILKQLEPDD